MRRLALAAALVALAIAFFGLRPKPTEGPLFRDFESYWAAGRAVDSGLDPYGRDVWSFERTLPDVVATRDEVLPFVGPPYGLPLWALFGTLSFEHATWLWGVLLTLSVATIALGSLVLAGGRPRGLEVVAIAVLCAGFGPLTSGVGLGQVAVVATAAAVLGALAAVRPGVRADAALGASALVSALQPNLAIALGAVGSPRRVIALFVAAAAALGLAEFGPYGGLGRYLALLRDHGDAERFIAIQTTFAAVARGYGTSASVAIGLGDAIALAVVVTLARQCLVERRAIAERFALACAAIPLAIPFAHEHDFTIVAIPAIYALRRAHGRTFDIAAIGTMLVSIDWLGLAQRPTGAGEAVGLAVSTGLAIASLSRGGRAGGILAPLAVVPFVILFGRLAHRLPTWPDALARTYHAPATWTITQVWFDEQARCGIAALDPWWATLRALSLAGCALVWIAVSRLRATNPPSPTAPAPVTPFREPAPQPRSSDSSIRPRPAAEGRPSS